jgi:hypothetical protein
LMNGILAAENFSIVENSFPLSFLTILTSVFYLWLAKKYWFRIPFIGILIATCCFIMAPIMAFFV